MSSYFNAGILWFQLFFPLFQKLSFGVQRRILSVSQAVRLCDKLDQLDLVRDNHRPPPPTSLYQDKAQLGPLSCQHDR